MKKLALAICLWFSLVTCSPKITKFAYFATETIHPQEVVDSLLGYRSEFQSWPSFEVMGVRRWDSTYIRTHIFYEELEKSYRNISVIEYGSTDTTTVRMKEGKK